MEDMGVASFKWQVLIPGVKPSDTMSVKQTRAQAEQTQLLWDVVLILAELAMH